MLIFFCDQVILLLISIATSSSATVHGFAGVDYELIEIGDTLRHGHGVRDEAMCSRLETLPLPPSHH